MALPSVLLLVLGGLTWNQNRIYRNEETLWRDTIAKNPSSWMAQNNLGLALTARGQTAAAAVHFEESLRLEPGNTHALGESRHGAPQKRQSRSKRKRRTGGPSPSARATAEAISNWASSCSVRAGQRRRGGRFCGRWASTRRTQRSPGPAQAKRQARALRDGQWNDPDQAQARYYLGKIFLEQGDLERAAEQYRLALRLRADFPNAHYWLGNILLQQGQLEQAASEYQATLRIMPSFADAHYNLAVALHRGGKNGGSARALFGGGAAQPQARQSSEQPGCAPARAGRESQQAIEHYRISLGIVPDNAEAHNNLGVALAARGSVGGGCRRVSRGLADQTRLHPGAKKPGAAPEISGE